MILVTIGTTRDKQLKPTQRNETMYLVIKWIEATAREVGVNSDGSTARNLSHSELFSNRSEAAAVAEEYGGGVYAEDDVFGSEF